MQKSTLTLFFSMALLAGCASRTAREPGAGSPASPSRPGGYYLDDGPGINPPANLDQIPDASPRWEPLHRFANRPYSVLGRDYTPATEHRPYKERGIASWYGRKFHAQRTSMGETYDMYAMTAAHPTLPLPSYARVTNVANGKSVVVRVNDRGPFLHGRIIDLSYTAASRLGYVNQGSALVDVEALLPEAIGIMAAASGASARGAAISTGARPPATAPPVTPLTSLAPLTPLAPIAPPARDPDLPLRIEGSDIFLQIAAFSNLDNAQNFLSVMEFQLSGNGYSQNEISYTPRIRSRDNLFRVEIGPYATRGEAQRAAADLESRFGVVPSPAAR
jgi:rare lipoprotein A